MAATMKSPISAADLTSIPDFIEKFKGVKSLVDSGITNIPDFYVRPKDERPGELDSTASVDQIPVFDLAALHGEGRGALVKAIGEACEEWGIFQVINHGVRSNVMKSMMGVSKGFFHLPMDEKMLYYSNVPSQPVRYGTSFNPLHESVLEWRDVLKHMVITSPPEENIQYWPDKPPAYREATKNYILEMMVVRTKILSAISEALGLDSNYLQGVFEQQMLGLNHYPECPNPDLALGISSHSDASGITILLQDGQVAALQALHQNRWVCVQPLPDSLVVIVGDQLQTDIAHGAAMVAHGAVMEVAHGAVMEVVDVWRANEFGVRPSAQPKMAVPFRAKDVPVEQAEYGHPDVAIMLTQLSYYNSGLNDVQLLEAFKRHQLFLHNLLIYLQLVNVFLHKVVIFLLQ